MQQRNRCAEDRALEAPWSGTPSRSLRLTVRIDDIPAISIRGSCHVPQAPGRTEQRRLRALDYGYNGSSIKSPCLVVASRACQRSYNKSRGESPSRTVGDHGLRSLLGSH